MSYTLNWNPTVADRILDDSMRELKKAADEIKGKSQAMCPVKSGTLRGSAYVDEIPNGYEIGYGGAAESYALEQHENLQYHHNVGQAKFLELAFIDVTENMRGTRKTE